MKRTERAEKARETLDIINSGYYEVDGRKVWIDDRVKHSIAAAKLYRSDEFGPVLEHAAKTIASTSFTPSITVKNCTVLQGAVELRQGSQKVGCLNFASAKNPGGGFLGGAQAQEESLALSSALYPTLMEHFEMYRYNRSRATLLYSDYMIYSPDVVFFRNDEGQLLPEPYELSFVTSPAVNLGAIKANGRNELDKVEETTLQRMDKVLALFVHHGIERLLLGAWGSGVFGNDPADMARYFAHFLTGNGKYARCFSHVLFAVYDRSRDGENIRAFERPFGAETSSIPPTSSPVSPAHSA